jgi:hypothetical protein
MLCATSNTVTSLVYDVNVICLSVQVKLEISLQKFVLWCSICLAVIEPSEKTRIGDLDIQAQDPTTPIEDINIVIASWKKGLNVRTFGQHEEWEQAFDKLQHRRRRRVLDMRQQ